MYIMKKKLLSIGLFVFCFVAMNQQLSAQVTVTVSGSATWVGYANVFDTSNNYQFGSSWAVADIKSTIDPATSIATLSPNFNTYNASDPYWSNGALGNKIFEGNTFVEDPALDGQTVTFKGNVTSNTLASGYTAIAFIKGLNPATGYSTDVSVTAPLVTGQQFSITANAIPSGLIVQYGFSVTGLNGNPANEAALGNVVVVPAALSVAQFENSQISMYPNPALNSLTISAKNNIEKLSVYNLLGQKVMGQYPNADAITLDISQLESGVYVMETTIDGKTATARFLKK